MSERAGWNQIARDRLSSALTRREVSRAILAGFLVGGPSMRARGEEPSGEAAEIASVSARAKMAGLGRFSVARTEHFLGLGNAPDSFRTSALKIGEVLGQAFLGHFKERGFELAFPTSRLTVITLKDDEAYAAFLGEDPGQSVGGHFDLDTNRLVVFDFRPGQDQPKEQAERLNRFTLVHETAHQLCFNCGLLSRESDVPKCVSEGLATYVEPWRSGVRSSIGSINRPRLDAIRQAGGEETPWIDVRDLLSQDRWFDDEKSEQLAYAEAWLLIHHLLRKRSRAEKLKAYLAAVGSGKKQEERTTIAEKALGPLRTLDRDLKREEQQLFSAR